MITLDMSLQVGLFAEDLAAAFSRAADGLAILLEVASMLQLRVAFHRISGWEDAIAESAADMGPLHVLLQLLHCREPNSIRCTVRQILVALFAPELDIGMLLLNMASQGRSSIETRRTTLMFALKSRHLQMLRANVTLEGLVFAEGLIARRKVSAPETFLALVNQLVAAETGAGQEAFPTASLLTRVFSLRRV